MTRFSLLAALAVLALTVLPQQALAQTSFTEAATMGIQPNDFPGQATAHPSLDHITFYSDRATFDADAGPLDNAEDFSGSLVTPNGLITCFGVVNSATNDACFTTGGVIDGFTFDSIYLITPNDDHVVIGPGFLGATSEMVGPNSFGDDSQFFFDDEPTAVGFDIAIDAPATFTIEIFGASGSLGSTTISPAGIPAGGSFFGVITADPIVRIDVTNTTNGAELFTGLTFGGCSGLTANAGPDQVDIEATSPDGAEVMLDGSGSCGDIASYSWAVRGGAEIATGVTPTVTAGFGTTAIVLTVSEAVDTALPHTDSDAVRIRVVDTTGPVITLVDGSEIDVPRFSGPFVDPGFSANDAYEGPVAITEDGGDDVDTDVVDTYFITYFAEDRFGNPTEVTRTVNVIDDPGAFVSSYALLSNGPLSVSSDTEIEGDAHTNGSAEFGGGDSSDLTGDVSAVGLLRIHNGQTIDGDASARRVLVGSRAEVTGTIFQGTVGSVTLPWVSASAGGHTVKLRAGEAYGIDPGSYGALRVGTGAVVTLRTGAYAFESISLSQGGGIEADVSTGPVVVSVAGNVIVRTGSQIAPVEGDIDARYLEIRATGSRVTIDDDSWIAAQIIAPSASVSIKPNVRVVGPVVGSRIVVSPGSTVLFAVERDDCRLLAPDPCDEEATADGVPETLAAPIAAASSTLPGEFALATPFPNPARSQATVSFDVPEASDVRVVVYDMVGRAVAVLSDGTQAPGTHRATLSGSDLPSGVYVVRMTAGSFVATQRLTIVR